MGPQDKLNLEIDPENIYFQADLSGNRRMKGCMKCCGVFILLSGMNALSFFVGHYVAEHDTELLSDSNSL